MAESPLQLAEQVRQRIIDQLKREQADRAGESTTPPAPEVPEPDAASTELERARTELRAKLNQAQALVRQGQQALTDGSITEAMVIVHQLDGIKKSINVPDLPPDLFDIYDTHPVLNEVKVFYNQLDQLRQQDNRQRAEIAKLRQDLEERYNSAHLAIEEAQRQLQAGHPVTIEELDSRIGAIRIPWTNELSADLQDISRRLGQKLNTAYDDYRQALTRAGEGREPDTEDKSFWNEEQIRAAFEQAFDLIEQANWALDRKDRTEYERLAEQVREQGTKLPLWTEVPDDLETLRDYLSRKFQGQFDELQNRGKLTLEQARAQFISARKRYKETDSLKNLLLSRESRSKISAESAGARADYIRLRAEFIGANVDNYIQEKERLVVAQMEEYAKERGGAKNLYNKFKGLSQQWNLGLALERKGKTFKNRLVRGALRSVNKRSLISLGLFGLGTVTGGTAVGIAAFSARRIISGITSGIGTYDLINLARGGLNRTKIENQFDQIGSSEKAEDYLAQIESRFKLDGKGAADLQNDGLYQKLLEKRRDLIKQELGTSMNQQELAELLDTKFQNDLAYLDKKLTETIASERNKRIAVLAASAAVGTVMASGVWMRLFKHAQGVAEAAQNAQGTPAVSALQHHPGHDIELQPETHAPVAPPPAPTEAPGPVAQEAPTSEKLPSAIHEAAQPPMGAKIELMHHGQPTGATLEAGQQGGAILHVGKRGIEGALLDLKENNPEEYQKVLGWMQTNYPDYKGSDAGIIHKFVTDFAHEHGYGVDSGNQDLSRIFGADIQIKPDGGVGLPADNIHFMPKGIDHIHDNLETPKTSHVTIGEAHEVQPMELRPDDLTSEVTAQTPGQVSEQAAETLSNIPERPFTLSDARDMAGLNVAKTSDGLRLMLKGAYKEFIKDRLQISAKSINKIQNMTIKEFIEKAKASASFAQTYRILYERTQHIIEHYPRVQNLNMKQVVLQLAKAWRDRK